MNSITNTPTHHYVVTRVPRVLIGSEAFSRLPEFLWVRECLSAVLIIDQAAADSGCTQRIKDALPKYPVAEFIIPADMPTTQSINVAALFARAYPRAVVIGMGNEYALETAKQVAAIVPSYENIEHYIMGANPFPGRRYQISIPTTASSTAVTRTGLVVSDQHLCWTRGEELLPDLVILDASINVHTTPTQHALNGLNLFVTAFEATSGQRSNAISDAHSLQAVQLLLTHLPIAVRQPDNLVSRQALLEAALLTSLSLENCGSGIAKCVSNMLHQSYGVPSAIGAIIGLEATLAWNIENADNRYDNLASRLQIQTQALPKMLNQLQNKVDFIEVFTAHKTEIFEAQNFDHQTVFNSLKLPENQSYLENNARVINSSDHAHLANQIIKVWNSYCSKISD